jgi:hypothetical protein
MQEPHTDILQVRTQPQLSAALKTAADQNLQTVSEFVRRTLIDKLREDGLLGRGQQQAGA